jgi:hypothetical protein
VTTGAMAIHTPLTTDEKVTGTKIQAIYSTDNSILSPDLCLTKRTATVAAQSHLTQSNATQLCLLPASHLTYTSTLKTEAVPDSKMSVNICQATQHYLRDNSTFHRLFPASVFLVDLPESLTPNRPTVQSSKMSVDFYCFACFLQGNPE